MSKLGTSAAVPSVRTLASRNDSIRRADQWDADENALIGIGL